MSLDVRTIDAADIYGWVRCMGTGFLFSHAEGYAEYFLGDVDLARTWGGFDGDTVVGTLRSFPTQFTVPGPAHVDANALTNVTVAPTHRRRGVLTRMITAELRNAAARGEPLGILIASEYPIYGRFGYGAAIEGATYRVDLAGTRFSATAEGEVAMVDLAELRAQAPAVYDHVRGVQPGAIERDARWWDRALHQTDVPGAAPAEGYQAIYYGSSGVPEGYVRYRARQKFDDMRKSGDLTIDELVAPSPAAYARLWQHCCSVDLITLVKAGDRPVDEMLPWLLEDGRAAVQTGRFDFIWVRILDPATALAGRRYSIEGRLVIEVIDPMGLAGGRFALEGGPAGASCAPSSDSADLAMAVDALGSLYAGGFRASTLGAAGRVDELQAGALRQADLMFASAVTPWCSTWF
jgi:predicted acetyltransferase